MEVKIGKFFESVGDFFSGGDQIPWCESDIVVLCEKVAAAVDAEKGSSDELKSEYNMQWFRALVHSKNKEDVQRGIDFLLKASSDGGGGPQKVRDKKKYLLAVGYYRIGDYPNSKQHVEQCLKEAPDWSEALSLQEVIRVAIKKDKAIGACTQFAVPGIGLGVLAGGITAAVTLASVKKARKK